MEEPRENKGLAAPHQKSADGEGKKVKVKIRQGRTITGVGKAGDVVEMDEAKAQEYQRDGYVTILNPFN
jgi:hypothetical protein